MICVNAYSSSSSSSSRWHTYKTLFISKSSFTVFTNHTRISKSVSQYVFNSITFKWTVKTVAMSMPSGIHIRINIDSVSWAAIYSNKLFRVLLCEQIDKKIANSFIIVIFSCFVFKQNSWLEKRTVVSKHVVSAESNDICINSTVWYEIQFM